MSEDPILTAITKLGTDLRVEIGKLGTDLQAEIAGSRTAIMRRIARLQDKVTEGFEQDEFLLQLLAQNQKIAESSQTTARTAMDLHGDLANALIALQRQVAMLSSRLDSIERKDDDA